MPDGWINEPMDQPLVCQNPFSWDHSKDWLEDKNNIIERENIKSTEILTVLTLIWFTMPTLLGYKELKRL